MGSYFGKAWKNLFKNKDVRILMVGLDSAGKTTIMYKIKINETVKTIPTIGFNMETMEYKGLSMSMWDIGGQDKIRNLWKHYYLNTDAIIYVVDSGDFDRIELAAEELTKMMLEPELDNATVLVYANKQDLNSVMSTAEVSEKLGMDKLKARKWLVQGSSATKGDGITEGLDWLANTLNNKKNTK